MKRIYLVAVLLVCAAACVTETTNTNTVNTNATNANAANSNSTSSATWTNDDIITNEKRAWDLIKAKDATTLGTMMADEFIDVESLKIYDKAGTLDFVKTFDITDMNLTDFKVVKVDKDAAVVTYTVNLKGSVGGKPIPANAPGDRHSTAVVMRGGKWLAVYHQATMIATAPQPSPSPASNTANANNANKTANANTANANMSTPAASPAMTSADAEANERMIWDMLQKKNFDGFAAMLADDAIEVEPDSVADKATSVNGVKQFFTGGTVTLSDFKTITLDDDAKLVTYMVKSNMKGFAPAGERHSTLWANRNGKWLAVFHQGTPIMNPNS